MKLYAFVLICLILPLLIAYFSAMGILNSPRPRYEDHHHGHGHDDDHGHGSGDSHGGHDVQGAQHH